MTWLQVLCLQFAGMRSDDIGRKIVLSGGKSCAREVKSGLNSLSSGNDPAKLRPYADLVGLSGAEMCSSAEARAHEKRPLGIVWTPKGQGAVMANYSRPQQRRAHHNAASLRWRCHAPAERDHRKPFCLSFLRTSGAGMPGKKTCTRFSSTLSTIRMSPWTCSLV